VTRSRVRKRREKLWQADPHCHWCGCLTVPPSGAAKMKRIPKNMATLDHLRSRYDSSRGSDCEEATVLACWQCNQRRSSEETAAKSRGGLWRRAGRSGGPPATGCHPEVDR
jgi:hypothetical protein